MTANKKMLFLPGDGIGPEVMDQVKRVMDGMAKSRAVNFDIIDGLVGGACYDAHGCAVTDETMTDAMNVDAVMLGAVGGPKWDDVARQHRPEAGLLRLRKDMDLYANLRPAIVFDALIDASTLKADVISGLDILILRELTAGVYFGEPRGIETLADGTRRGLDTQVYTEAEIERIARLAFELAGKRNGRVTSSEKANVMESGVFWREVVTNVHKVVDPTIGANFCVGIGASINCGIGTNFAVIADNHPANLRDLHVAFGIRCEAKAILADAHTGIDIDPRANNAVAKGCPCAHAATLAQNHAFPHDGVRADGAARAQFRIGANNRAVGNTAAVAQLRLGAHMGALGHTGGYFRFGV